MLRQRSGRWWFLLHGKENADHHKAFGIYFTFLIRQPLKLHRNSPLGPYNNAYLNFEHPRFHGEVFSYLYCLS